MSIYYYFIMTSAIYQAYCSIMYVYHQFVNVYNKIKKTMFYIYLTIYQCTFRNVFFINFAALSACTVCAWCPINVETNEIIQCPENNGWIQT